MLIVQDVLISNEVVQKQFSCHLEACKGACCWEGDFGAPLEEAERATLESIYEQVKPFVSLEGQALIESTGKFTFFEEPGFYGTPLLEDGACAYMTFDERGIAQCSIEQADRDGAIEFQKPLSCHLYPLRIKSQEELAFEAINFDSWEICSPACTKGRAAQLPVYQFVREALIRKYGAAFYEELDAAARHFLEQSEEGAV